MAEVEVYLLRNRFYERVERVVPGLLEHALSGDIESVLLLPRLRRVALLDGEFLLGEAIQFRFL